MNSTLFLRLRRARGSTTTSKLASTPIYCDEQPVVKSAFSPLVTFSKRLSKRWTVVASNNSEDIIDSDNNNDPNVTRLLLVLENKKQRNELVNKMLCGSTDSIIKVRFCIVTGEYANAKDKHEKRAKGRKIVGLFIQNGSMFCLDGVPYSIQQTLLGGKDQMFAECFEDLRNIFVQELASQRQVLEALRNLDDNDE